MANRRARIIAAVVVLTTTLVSAAYGAFTITSNPAESNDGNLMSAMRILVSIRNTSGAPITITSIDKTQPRTTTCATSISIAPESGAFPITLVNNEQRQFVVSSPGFSFTDTLNGDPSCQFDIITSPLINIEQFTATFFVGAVADAWDLQPKLTNFGSQSGFEIQKVYVQNNQGVTQNYVTIGITDPTGSMTFESTCQGQQQCTSPGSVGSGQVQDIAIKCQPTQDGFISGTLSIYGASAVLATKSLECSGFGQTTGATINIVPDQIDIVTPQTIEGMTLVDISYLGMADWSMTQLVINGDFDNTFRFTDPACTPHQCDWPSPTPLPLPAMISIACTPSDAVTKSATLVAQGIGGANDFDMAILRCVPSAGGPVIQVSSNMIDAPPTRVAGLPAGPFPLTITNVGDGTLSASLVFSSSEWTASSCVGTPCELTGLGSNATVEVYFDPTEWGDRSSNLLINSNDPGNGMVNVSLIGIGSGATLEVTDPPSPGFEIDFGTIPKGSPAERPLSFLTSGNVSVDVDATAPAQPFSVTPLTVNLSPGTPGAMMVVCSSSTPGSFTTTIPLATTAYEANTSSISAKCMVADTDIQITPTTFDFGEVRAGTDAVSRPIAITNPTASDVTIQSLRLSASSPVLALSPTITSPMTIASGATLDAMLTLTPTQDSDLAGLSLLIRVDDADLVFPITGKVVTPAAHVTPDRLDLGTACVGSQVTGTVMMVNDGTATLTMQRPTMNQAFTAVHQSPSTYPSPLLEGHSAMIGVTPSMSASGMLVGTLTWEVDAPNSPFTVPVSLEYIADGTAVSPRGLTFGTIDVDASSTKQTVTLHNCSVAPSTVRILGVTATAGPVTAWRVEPRTAETTLASQGKQTITVEFAPTAPGPHRAQIQLEIDGVASVIGLEGDAFGRRRDVTSFYACSCSGPVAPSQAWPIPLVLAVILRRKRRC